MGVDWFEHLHPVMQPLLGTLFTWFLPALGAGLGFAVMMTLDVALG